MRRLFLDTQTSSATSSTLVVLLSGVWLAVFGNLALWHSLMQLPELTGWRSGVFGGALALIIAGVMTGLLSLLAWRWTLKPVISAMLLCAGVASHFMWRYAIVVDTPMMVNMLHTDSREALEQLSPQLVLSVAGVAAWPLWWLWRQPWQPLPWKQQIGRNLTLCAAALVVTFTTAFAVFPDLASVMRNHPELRYKINPLNTLYALLDMTVIPPEQRSATVRPLAQDAHRAARADSPASRPPLLVLVLGETARSNNFSLNGYARATNPLLSLENVVSFRHVTSCGTSTAESLPCMLSPLGREAFNSRQHESENLLDVLQRSGYAVLWMDNQSGCKGLCDRIPHVNTSDLKLAGECEDGECRDTVMLARIDAELLKLPPEQRAHGVVVVMHQMGSHGPAYHKRTPKAFKPFQPECQENALSPCDRQQLLNAYDNTLVFTDYFLSRLIGWLKSQEKHNATAMLYVSDHGESLGENNLYLHGLPFRMAPEVQKQVAMISWLSASFERWSGVSSECLRQQRDRPLSHDNLFHSVLGIMSVQTREYLAERDVFLACQAR